MPDRAIDVPVSLASSCALGNVTGFAAVDPSESSPAVGQTSVPGDGGTEHLGRFVRNDGVCACSENGATATRTAAANAASRCVEGRCDQQLSGISRLLAPDVK